jgi:hypothetical protein
MSTIHDLILGPALDSRPCGDCVACCEVLNIAEPDIVKPAGQMCMHCTGAGCGIHESRPQVCRAWDCVWRRIDSMPPQTRPDQMGVVFTIDRQADPQTPFDRLYFVGRAVSDPAALQGQHVPDVAGMLAHGPLPIFLTWDDSRMLVYPRAALADAILDPLRTADPALVEEGREWMERFTPFARLADEAARQARNA